MSFTSYRRSITLPVTEERVLIMNKQADSPRAFVIRHEGKSGQTGPATIKFQESMDATNYYDISGTAQNIDAGAGTSLLITSTNPYVALSGYGNVDIEVEIIRSDPDSVLPQSVSI